MALRPEFPNRGRNRVSLPNQLHPPMHTGGKIGHRAHAAELTQMNDRDPVAQGFRVRQNMCGKENRLSRLLQSLHEIAYFAASHGIKSRHRLIQENNFGIVQDGLRNSHTL